MIKIYGTENSRAMRPIWTAEEMGLDYELIMMPFPPRVFMKEYLDINILGTVPYMIDGDVKMTESVGISQYLVEKYGPSDLQVQPNENDYPARLKLLEKSLDNKEYLCSDRFTLADICVSYAINLADALGIEQAFKPNIKRWSKNLFSRPAFIKSKSYKYEQEN